ncbi:hypothetical protein AFLA_010338 [Aspergillus flavus NRRL3357]|nr:hypothetical protein AFLA_010338 [Aspergillus flavus NRRL3357]
MLFHTAIYSRRKPDVVIKLLIHFLRNITGDVGPVVMVWAIKVSSIASFPATTTTSLYISAYTPQARVCTVVVNETSGKGCSHRRRSAELIRSKFSLEHRAQQGAHHLARTMLLCLRSN